MTTPDTRLRASSATKCPPSGSATTRPGSPGRITPTDWPGKFQAIPWVYADIVRKLSQVETVHILVDNEAAEKRAASILIRAGANPDNVTFHRIPTDRVWTRDSGPIFVTKPGHATVAVTNWKFNAWAKYENWHLDDQVAGKAAEFLKVPAWKPSHPARQRRRASHRPRRRKHRRQRRRHAHHHRRMPAQHRPAAQSRSQPRAVRAGLSRLSRHRSGLMDESRLRRRRHSRPRRRHHPLRRRKHNCHRH